MGGNPMRRVHPIHVFAGGTLLVLLTIGTLLSRTVTPSTASDSGWIGETREGDSGGRTNAPTSQVASEPARTRKPVTFSPLSIDRTENPSIVQGAAPSLMVLMGIGLNTQDAYRMLVILSESGADAAADPTSPYSLISRTLAAQSPAEMKSVFAGLADRMALVRADPLEFSPEAHRTLMLTLAVCSELAATSSRGVGGDMNDVLRDLQMSAIPAEDRDLRRLILERMVTRAPLPVGGSDMNRYAAIMRLRMTEAAESRDPVALEEAAQEWMRIEQSQRPEDQAWRKHVLNTLMQRARSAP